MEKTRDGARVTKRYHPPFTPFQRVVAHPGVPQTAMDDLAAQFAQFDPVVLLHDVGEAQVRLAALVDAKPWPESDGNPRADVDAFLDGLRHAWKEGKVAQKGVRAEGYAVRSARNGLVARSLPGIHDASPAA